MPLRFPRRRLLSAAAAALLAGAAALPAEAQPAWPARPIRLVVPYTPGGFTDQMARLVQPGLQQLLGQTIVVDNRPGANSIIGVDAVAKAAPDGYTFAVVIAAYAANTTLYPKLPYDPAKDLQGVALLGVSPLLAAVNNQAPFRTARELAAYAKAHPGELSYGSSGNGSAAHLTSELFKSVTGTDMVHVPYKGAAPALTGLLGNETQLLLDAPTGLINMGQQGKVRLIGVAGDKRLPALPEVPTFIEQGFAGFTGSTWAGVLAPAGTPPETVRRMAEALTAVIRGDALRPRLEAMGTFAGGGTPAEFDAFIAAETAKWGKVIREAKVRMDP
jgi:tripartite-type tricarboxylate transporter receptor subunit TctC